MWMFPLLACNGPRDVGPRPESAQPPASTIDTGAQALPCGDCVGSYVLACQGAEATIRVWTDADSEPVDALAVSADCDGVELVAAEAHGQSVAGSLGAIAAAGALGGATDHGQPQTLELYDVRESESWTWARWFLTLDDGRSEWWETAQTRNGLRYVRYDAQGSVEAQGSRIGPRAAEVEGCTWTSDHLASGLKEGARSLSLTWQEVRTWSCDGPEGEVTAEATFVLHTATPG